MIFGHGIDADLAESIKVTIIATGFEENGNKQNQESKRKVYDLEKNTQTFLFEEKSTGKPKRIDEFVLKVKKEEPAPEKPAAEEPVIEDNKTHDQVIFDLNSEYELEDMNEKKELPQEPSKPQVTPKPQFTPKPQVTEKVDIDAKKQYLQEQAKARAEKLHGNRNPGMTDEEFKEKWETPAYQRKNIKLKDVPHSSEHEISRYNLNDDNAILGNNKFLHDNVD